VNSTELILWCGHFCNNARLIFESLLLHSIFTIGRWYDGLWRIMHMQDLYHVQFLIAQLRYNRDTLLSHISIRHVHIISSIYCLSWCLYEQVCKAWLESHNHTSVWHYLSYTTLEVAVHLSVYSPSDVLKHFILSWLWFKAWQIYDQLFLYCAKGIRNLVEVCSLKLINIMALIKSSHCQG
jgi:hypothetical protein